MKFATLPRIQRPRLQTSISQSPKSLRAPREKHRFGPSSSPPRLPTFLQPSGICHVLRNVSKSLRLPRETHFKDNVLYFPFYLVRFPFLFLLILCVKTDTANKANITNQVLLSPSVSRFDQNYPLLLVPSPGCGSSGDHCDLSGQTDSNWPSLCLVRNNFRRPGVSRRLGAWELRFWRI